MLPFIPMIFIALLVICRIFRDAIKGIRTSPIPLSTRILCRLAGPEERARLAKLAHRKEKIREIPALQDLILDGPLRDFNQRVAEATKPAGHKACIEERKPCANRKCWYRYTLFCDTCGKPNETSATEVRQMFSPCMCVSKPESGKFTDVCGRPPADYPHNLHRLYDRRFLGCQGCAEDWREEKESRLTEERSQLLDVMRATSRLADHATFEKASHKVRSIDNQLQALTNRHTSR